MQQFETDTNYTQNTIKCPHIYLSLTQLETLHVQRVTDVVTEFVQNVPLLPAHRLEVVCATHQLRCQQHSVPCRTIQETLLQLIHIVNA